MIIYVNREWIASYIPASCHRYERSSWAPMVYYNYLTDYKKYCKIIWIVLSIPPTLVAMRWVWPTSGEYQSMCMTKYVHLLTEYIVSSSDISGIISLHWNITTFANVLVKIRHICYLSELRWWCWVHYLRHEILPKLGVHQRPNLDRTSVLGM